MSYKNLLLHTCCAPCLSHVLFVLTGKTPYERVIPFKPEFETITLYFQNSNIQNKIEYELRKDQLTKILEHFPNVKQAPALYDPKTWTSTVKGLEKEPEGGKRCTVCFHYRLKDSFLYAKEHNYDCVATTLTISPHKNATLINTIGNNLSEKYKIAYVPSNFKKQEGYKHSIELCKNWNIYRQCYCGCMYSQLNEEEKN